MPKIRAISLFFGNCRDDRLRPVAGPAFSDFEKGSPATRKPNTGLARPIGRELHL
jgi:hypothetical protein